MYIAVKLTGPDTVGQILYSQLGRYYYHSHFTAEVTEVEQFAQGKAKVPRRCDYRSVLWASSLPPQSRPKGYKGYVICLWGSEAETA